MIKKGLRMTKLGVKMAGREGQNDKKKGLRMTKLGVRMAGREGQNDRHVVTLRRSRRVSLY